MGERGEGGYKPTKREMSDAEPLMNDTQRELSEEREANEPLRKRYRDLTGGNPESPDNQSNERIRELTGFSREQMYGPVFRNQKGEIVGFRIHDQGHEIEANEEGTRIDGVPLPREHGGRGYRIWEKYRSQLETSQAGFIDDPKKIERAQREVEVSAEEFAAKEAVKRALEIADELLGEDVEAA